MRDYTYRRECIIESGVYAQSVPIGDGGHMVRKTKEEAAATRNSLIDAAERVFCEKGVSRASLSDIANAAGATRGAIYWHFRDKVDLFNAMMDRVTLPLEQGCAQFSCVAVADPVARLRAVISFVLGAVASNAQARRVFEIALFKIEYVDEMAAARDRHIAASDAFTAQLAQDLTMAQESAGEALAMPPHEAAVALHALFDGLIQNWLLCRAGFDLVRVGVSASDSFLRGLGLRVPVDGL
ncbi:TetR family transcriptional regulator [Acidovorax sp. DW039]|nr:TetR family transcriptional regulator [Acidovorax sp. DW039]